MNFTQDQIAAIIGAKELELISLRWELARKEEEIAKLKEPKVTEMPKVEVASGAA